ncbi:MAG: 7-carboxy-7-deazaguanine synthase QueE [Chlorobiales bacterium]|nr:7-carboxy-7-deazaguanine synthase QueE [Chlorobiales bacterium]
MSETLLVNETFLSIQGESTYAGWPCTFIRLAGCQSSCTWCDTRHASTEEGTSMTLSEITEHLVQYRTPLVEITGGEPLQQENVYALMRQLCDRDYTVLLETGGFLPVDRVDHRVHKIIDLKTPSSGESERNCLENIELAAASPDSLKKTFEFKCVVACRKDYEWARNLLNTWDLTAHCTVLMGSVFGEQDPAELARWILEDHLHVKLQLQLHKYIWPPDKRRV